MIMSIKWALTICILLCCLSMTTLSAKRSRQPRNGVKRGRHDQRSVEKAVRGCEYEGKLYSPRATFKPDACSQCRCPRKGGPVQCTVEDCGMETTHCLTFSNDTTQCCPVCQEYGCRHVSGTLFKPGEVIRNEPCVRCYCPLGGGNPVCDVTTCPLSQCVDPVKIEGVCCPVCPHGPNCQIGLLTLPIGQSVVIEGALCTCETFIGWDGQKRTLARCNKS